MVNNRKSFGDEAAEDALKVTRSIMIVRRPVSNLELPPASPGGSTTPTSTGGTPAPASPFSCKACDFVFHVALEESPGIRSGTFRSLSIWGSSEP